MKIILSLILLLTNSALAESFNSRGDGQYIYSNKFNNRPLSQKGPGFVDLVKGRFTPIQTDENKKMSTDLKDYSVQQQALIATEDTDPSCLEPKLSCFAVNDDKDEKANLAADLKVCGCLETRFGIDLNFNKARERKLEEDKLDAALMKFGTDFEKSRDALLLEAHFTSPEQLASMKSTISIDETAAAITEVINSYKGKVSQEYIDLRLNKIPQHVQSLKDKEKEKGKTILDNFNEQTKKEDSCFPYDEYLKVTMIPDAKEFWQDLKDNAKPQSSRSWNYYDILGEYQAGINPELNKAKLDFLNRNPSLKVIFSGINEELKEHTYLRMVQALNPDQNCINEGTCRANFIAQGKSLQENLADLMVHPNIKSLLVGSHFVQNMNEIQSLDKNAFNGPPSLSSLRDAHKKDNISYQDCGRNTSEDKVASCLELLKGYCYDVKGQKDALENSLYANYTYYQDDWKNDLEVDPIDNKNYIAFQEKMCQNMARKYKGKHYNLAGFREVYCQEHSCGDDQEVLQFFMSKASATDREFDQSQNLIKSSNLEAVKLAEASVKRKINAGTIDINTLNEVKDSRPLNSNKSVSKKSNPSINDIIAEIENGKAKQSTLHNPNFAAAVAIPPGTENSNPEMRNNALNIPGQGMTPPSNSVYSEAAISDARNELNHLKHDEAKIKQEVMEVEKEIAQVNDSEMKIALNVRLENLERMLAEKEKSSQEYQKLITKLLDSKDTNSASSAKVQDSNLTDTTSVEKMGSSRKSAPANSVAMKNILNEEPLINPHRAPASVESFTTTGTNSSGAVRGLSSPASFSSSSSKSRINGALLSKYGIIVQETPGVNTSVAQEMDGARLQVMGPFKNAQDFPLEVSALAFEKFKANDLSALQELYQNSLEKNEHEVIKILVSSENSAETLEFYAIKEEGKVVFQPIRKVRLADLRNTLSY